MGCARRSRRQSRIKPESFYTIKANDLKRGDEVDLQHVGAVVGFVQESSLHDEAQHLLVGHALVRLFGQGGDLPQHHTERPAAGNEAAP